MNYDYPPEYAEASTAPAAFEIFTDRIATWIDSTSYQRLYSYLIERHQRKLDAALEKAEREPTVIEIPSASFNSDTGNYSGDRFKSQGDIVSKLNAVQALKDDTADKTADELPPLAQEFYSSRPEYCAPDLK